MVAPDYLHPMDKKYWERTNKAKTWRVDYDVRYSI